jgi:hypothetical protein
MGKKEYDLSIPEKIPERFRLLRLYHNFYSINIQIFLTLDLKIRVK